jgi:hypothetical protein
VTESSRWAVRSRAREKGASRWKLDMGRGLRRIGIARWGMRVSAFILVDRGRHSVLHNGRLSSGRSSRRGDGVRSLAAVTAV